MAKAGHVRADPAADPGTGAPGSQAGPRRGALVLTALILVAAVANLNLLIASMALPEIGRVFNAGQTELNLVAVAFSLGLAASVLYLGAIGDRYGRKLMLIAGTGLSIPACLVAAWAPSIPVLFAARFTGGIAAGMSFPTTLALITALWSGPARTRAIALWSALGGAIVTLGPLLAGVALERFWWGSAFLITVPLAAVALALAQVMVPAHVNESTGRVDHVGGIASVIGVAALIMAINLAVVPRSGALVIGFSVITAGALAAFVLQQRRTPFPLYDLKIAGRRTFWVAAGAGIVVFGALMGGTFVGQQFMQNVLGYSTLESGLAGLPGAVVMVLVAPHSARLIGRYGSRATLLLGYLLILLGFVVMLLLWQVATAYWEVGLGYALIGAGVGFAGTPASHSLTGSVPVRRAGMASATADLQRDLGGAIMVSILGALLTAGYATAVAASIRAAAQPAQITTWVRTQLTKSYAGAQEISQRYPRYAGQITTAARDAFLHGAHWAYLAGILAVLAGAGLVFFLFPRHGRELELLRRYHRQDAAR